MNKSDALPTAAQAGGFGLSRFNQILIGLFIVQLVLAILIFVPRNQPAPTGKPLLGDLDLTQVTKVVLTGDNDQQIEFDKTDDTWVMAGTDDYPVQGTKVPDLLDILGKLNTDRLVTSTESSHKRLQVADDDFVRRVELDTADGKNQTIYIGSSPNVNATHVRLGSQDEAYLVSDVTTWQMNPDPSSWIDVTYFSLPTDSIKTITVQNEGGELDFSQVSTGTWTMAGLEAGEELLTNNITSLATQISSLRLAEPIGKEAKSEFGLDQPTATVTITAQTAGEAEQTYTLTVGAKDPDADRYVVKASNADYYVWVNGFSLDKFLRSRTDYLAQPEEAAPAEGAPEPADNSAPDSP